jgi:hypothetical protein
MKERIKRMKIIFRKNERLFKLLMRCSTRADKAAVKKRTAGHKFQQLEKLLFDVLSSCFLYF